MWRYKKEYRDLAKRLEERLPSEDNPSKVWR